MKARHLLHRYAQATAVATFGLLVAGGLVTSTDSGLAVPDWPLSYGTWFPPMVGGIRYEHGHRMIAGVVGLMILGLALWLWRVESRRWVRRLGWLALGVVVTQALLGGVTVLWLLPPPVSIAHACLGPSVFILTACLAFATAPSFAAPASTAPRTAALGLAVAAAAAGQLLLGAIVRHPGAGVWWHAAGAGLLTLLACRFLLRLRRDSELPHRLRRGAGRLAMLLSAQWVLGWLAFTHRHHVLVVTGHMAIGSLVLAQTVHVAWQGTTTEAWRALERRGADYLALTKPRVVGLVLVTVAAGFWLGLPAGASMAPLVPLVLGTALAAGGANALNQWWERVPDGLMARTRCRPLPAGRLSPDAACRFGVGSCLLGVLLLALAVNLASALLTTLTAAVYLLAYTPLKRVTSLCTLVGAVPGALPPVIGWAAARGGLSIEAWGLFGILFLWQLPHFLAIAVLYRDEYARAGFRMLPVLEPDGWATARQTVVYGLVLLPVSLVPAMHGVAGMWYGYGALALGTAFLAVALKAAWLRSVPACRQLFLASVTYLPLLLLLMAVDKRSVL